MSGDGGASNAPTRRRLLAVFSLLLGVYLATSSFRVETIDTAIRLEVARGLVERGAPDLEKIEMRTPFGVVGSFEGRDGRFYSVYGLGQSLLMIPFVAIGGDLDAALVTLVNPIVTAATCTCLIAIATALGFSASAGTLLAILVGLGTLAWPQAKFTFEAPVEAGCLTFAVWALLGRSPARIAAAGALFGFAIFSRPAAVLMGPGLAWLVLAREPDDRRRRVLAFGSGCLPWIALAFTYNAYRWGSPFATGYAFTRFRYLTLSWEGLVGLLVSPGRGFFWYSPILLLAPFAFRRFHARCPDLARMTLVTFVSYVGFLSFTTIWNGDWTWGPRHLLPLVPLVALAALPLLEPEARSAKLLAPLFAISVAVQLVGATINYEAYFLWHNDRLRREGRIERAGRYHFDPATSQLYVQTRQALLFWARLPERMREFRLDEPSDPYRPILEGSPTITKRVPDVWWVYFPLRETPGAASLALGALCAALVAGGALTLRNGAET